ncbi:unnamed protein product [Vitrella brassicaformis CCMP3155]|uniref:RCC1-like domain-containing protein n=1 Tax=Vitrella brassicaformis (strain CCMP3155) TaxID=1169540 RepID=A0A0G4FGU8_VITBC|nr:unnamed protein product [Vitrella brassicaformis CCMP3155]|eukprot:CEM12726.1 unnamed protein product [Vitrella brassicaformis CCMP3155]
MTHLYSWGSGSYGRLGHGHSDDIDFPTRLGPLNGSEVISACCGWYHSCLVTRQGGLLLCGSQVTGCLGTAGPLASTDTDKKDESVAKPSPLSRGCFTPPPVAFPPKTAIMSVAAGGGMLGAHTLALSRCGRVWAWGFGPATGLGVEKDHVSHPSPIDDLRHTRVAQIAAGSGFSVALTEGGRVYTWGMAASGRLGYRVAGPNQLYPAPVEGLKGVVVSSVSAGAAHCLAISSQGALYSWGENARGQLGIGDLVDSFEPRRVRDPWSATQEGSRFRLVSCGESHSMAVDSQGRLFTWGACGGPTLGHGTLAEANELVGFAAHFRISPCSFPWVTPKQVLCLRDCEVRSISGAFTHSIALTAQGMLFAWGSPSHTAARPPPATSDRLEEEQGWHEGRDEPCHHWMPRLVHLPLLGFESVAAGGWHSFAGGKVTTLLEKTLESADRTGDVFYELPDGCRVYAHSAFLQVRCPAIVEAFTRRADPHPTHPSPSSASQPLQSRASKPGGLDSIAEEPSANEDESGGTEGQELIELANEIYRERAKAAKTAAATQQKPSDSQAASLLRELSPQSLHALVFFLYTDRLPRDGLGDMDVDGLCRVAARLKLHRLKALAAEAQPLVDVPPSTVPALLASLYAFTERTALLLSDQPDAPSPPLPIPPPPFDPTSRFAAYMTSKGFHHDVDTLLLCHHKPDADATSAAVMAHSFLLASAYPMLLPIGLVDTHWSKEEAYAKEKLGKKREGGVRVTTYETSTSSYYPVTSVNRHGQGGREGEGHGAADGRVVGLVKTARDRGVHVRYVVSVADMSRENVLRVVRFAYLQTLEADVAYDRRLPTSTLRQLIILACRLGDERLVWYVQHLLVGRVSSTNWIDVLLLADNVTGCSYLAEVAIACGHRSLYPVLHKRLSIPTGLEAIDAKTNDKNAKKEAGEPGTAATETVMPSLTHDKRTDGDSQIRHRQPSTRSHVAQSDEVTGGPSSTPTPPATATHRNLSASLEEDAERALADLDIYGDFARLKRERPARYLEIKARLVGSLRSAERNARVFNEATNYFTLVHQGDASARRGDSLAFPWMELLGIAALCVFSFNWNAMLTFLQVDSSERMAKLLGLPRVEMGTSHLRFCVNSVFIILFILICYKSLVKA